MIFFALILSNPKPIISIVRNNNVLYKMPFCHLAPLKDFQVSEILADIKYKFGIQVPIGIKSSIQSDKNN
jgi:hypothetical protein